MRRSRCAPSGICSASPRRIRSRSATRPTVFWGSKEGSLRVGLRRCLRDSFQLFAEYIDWRADHPSDDLITQLLNAEIEDDGGLRPLTRTEVLTYTSMVAGAGNETTTRLIGFIGQFFSDHPDQRRELVDDHSLIPRAIEEALRFEAPSPVQARYVASDTECRGERIAEGSMMLLINGSANRDEASYPDGERFDIHRGGGHRPSGRACTSAWAPRWRACRHGWRSKRWSSVGRTGRSTTRTPVKRIPPACVGGRNCPLSSASPRLDDAAQHGVPDMQ